MKCRVILLLLLVLFSNVHADNSNIKAEVQASYDLAENWFIKSVTPNGMFRYLHDTQLNIYSKDNNAIRQLMASRLLAELSSKNESYVDLHKKNLSYLLNFWIKYKDGYSYVLFKEKSKLGANAMMLRTLVSSPFFDKYKIQARSIKNGILKGINSDGSMTPFLIEPNYKYDADYLLTFYSGEALLALVEYYEKVKDAELLPIIKKSQDYYLKAYVKNISKNYYPAYVPWHTLSLNKLYKLTNEKKYAKAIFVLNDKLLEIQDKTSHIGRFYNPKTPQFGSPHASSDGVYTEGLVYAYEIASILNDKSHMKRYDAAIKIAMKHLISLQYNNENISHLVRPLKVVGGFRISRSSPKASFAERKGSNIRVDSVQHTMDAFRKFLSL